MGLRRNHPELANHLDSFNKTVLFDTYQEPDRVVFICQKCRKAKERGLKPSAVYEWHVTRADIAMDPEAAMKCQAVLGRHREEHRQKRIKFVRQRLNDGLYPQPDDDEMIPLPKPKL